MEAGLVEDSAQPDVDVSLTIRINIFGRKPLPHRRRVVKLHKSMETTSTLNQRSIIMESWYPASFFKAMSN